MARSINGGRYANQDNRRFDVNAGWHGGGPDPQQSVRDARGCMAAPAIRAVPARPAKLAVGPRCAKRTVGRSGDSADTARATAVGRAVVSAARAQRRAAPGSALVRRYLWLILASFLFGVGACAPTEAERERAVAAWEGERTGLELYMHTCVEGQAKAIGRRYPNPIAPMDADAIGIAAISGCERTRRSLDAHLRERWRPQTVDRFMRSLHDRLRADVVRFLPRWLEAAP